MKLEKMESFFAALLSGYDKHMITEIDGLEEFYPYTAQLLPKKHDVNVLDLKISIFFKSKFSSTTWTVKCSQSTT